VTKRIKKPVMPIRKGQDDWARENKQKADLFAQHFVEFFILNDMQNNNNLEEINNSITEEITTVTPKEIAEEIKFTLNLRRHRTII
jgi:hypothetical protein